MRRRAPSARPRRTVAIARSRTLERQTNRHCPGHEPVAAAPSLRRETAFRTSPPGSANRDYPHHRRWPSDSNCRAHLCSWPNAYPGSRWIHRRQLRNPKEMQGAVISPGYGSSGLFQLFDQKEDRLCISFRKQRSVFTVPISTDGDKRLAFARVEWPHRARLPA